MATITYTPNLSLKISSDDDAITKYNLNRIDYLAQKITIAVDGDTQLSSSTNVDIFAAYGLGVNRYNGVITIDAGNLGTFDTSSRVQVNAKIFNVATNGGTISLDAASINFNGATPSGLGLSEGKVFIGNSSNEAEEKTISGDATIDSSGVLNISPGAIGTGKLSDDAVTGDKIASETITNDNINGSAGIEYGKLNLTGGIVDADISASALIDQSKIFGLVGALAGKEPTLTKGNLVGSPPSVLSVSGGTNAVIGSGVNITIPRANTVDSGYLHYSDYARFNNYAPSETSDITSSTDGVTITGGEDVVPNGTGVTIDVDTADSTHTGLLTSTDWNTFNGKEAGGAVSTHESTYNHSGYDSHVGSTSNPHSVTKDQVGLSNVTNDAQLPIAGGTMTGQLGLDNQGLLFNIVDDYVGTPSEGTLWWNKDDHTVNIQGDVVGTILQVGQENWLRAKNETGAPIPEGAAVYINGANTARPTIALAIATSAATADRVLGVATHTIAHGDLGVVTTFGLVRGLTTNVDGDGVALSDGDCVYLSSTTAGEWVKAKPHAPNHCVKIGQIVNAGPGGSGNLFVSVHTGAHLQDLHDVNIETGLADNQVLQYDSGSQIWNNVTLSHTHLADIGTNTHAQIDAYITEQQLLATVHGEKTGFEDPSGIGISYDSGAQTVTLTHSSGTIAYWIRGTRYTRSSPYTPAAHTDNTANNYFGYFKPDNTWSWETSFQGFNSNAWVYTVFVYYKSDAKFAMRECHGFMDWESWQGQHSNIGTYRNGTGGTVTGGITPNSNDANAIKPLTAQVTLQDEDCPTVVPAVTAGATYTTVHFSGGSPVFTTGLTWPFLSTGTEIQYNVGGTALAVVGGNNRWVNYYGVYMPVTSDAGSQTFRLVWIAGQQIYTSLASAQAEDFRSLDTSPFGMAILEFLPFIKLTIRRDSTYNNIRMARIDSASPYVTYLSGSRAGYITVAGFSPSTAAATRYSTSLSWSGVGPYTMTILGTTHGRGTEPIVRVRELISGTTYEVVDIDSITLDSLTGDVTLTSSSNFTGTVVIL